MPVALPFLLLGLLAATPAAAQAPAARPGPADMAGRLLAAHNMERTRVGVPPLRWSPALAAAAAAYGPSLATRLRLEHSPRGSRPGQSENLWRGSAGRFSPEQMVASWASERRYFRPGIFPAVSSTTRWMDVGHYTQMIWRGTTSVGCALYRARQWDYLICRYSPRGNIDRQRVP